LTAFPGCGCPAGFVLLKATHGLKTVFQFRGGCPNREEAELTLDTILAALKTERDRITRAIAALEGTATAAPARGTAAPATARKRRRRKMSAEARQRLSEFKKKWWAKRKRSVR
jgi:hypothetical protein